MVARSFCILFLSTLCAGGCDQSKSTPAPPASTKSIRAKVRGIQIKKARAQGSVSELVAAERTKAQGEGRQLLIYVGASWCEPCERFKKAARDGELNGKFPNLTLLEFDRDGDEARLKSANCSSRLIPLFAVPSAQGHCSANHIEGSIKGPGAVAQITPRLAALLGK